MHACDYMRASSPKTFSFFHPGPFPTASHDMLASSAFTTQAVECEPSPHPLHNRTAAAWVYLDHRGLGLYPDHWFESIS